ncbi:carbonic anhydrase 5A, mitochondrial isoform X4 [Felis catus]|uniref:carbonic anhydrase 5A, mitochondrial isoform X4 n=1 Tax=Felis catus TaxID=9685 RepID=UPI001D1A1EE8|nr:carbonic anhydrase 5A, mitochondrial isoform X4 [Felis catus]
MGPGVGSGTRQQEPLCYLSVPGIVPLRTRAPGTFPPAAGGEAPAGRREVVPSFCPGGGGDSGRGSWASRRGGACGCADHSPALMELKCPGAVILSRKFVGGLSSSSSFHLRSLSVCCLLPWSLGTGIGRAEAVVCLQVRWSVVLRACVLWFSAGMKALPGKAREPRASFCPLLLPLTSLPRSSLPSLLPAFILLSFFSTHTLPPLRLRLICTGLGQPSHPPPPLLLLLLLPASVQTTSSSGLGTDYVPRGRGELPANVASLSPRLVQPSLTTPVGPSWPCPWCRGQLSDKTLHLTGTSLEMGGGSSPGHLSHRNAQCGSCSPSLERR